MVYIWLCIEEWQGNKVFAWWKAWETSNNMSPYVIKQMNILPFLYINKGHKECGKTLFINRRNIVGEQSNPLKPYLLAK